MRAILTHQRTQITARADAAAVLVAPTVQRNGTAEQPRFALAFSGSMLFPFEQPHFPRVFDMAAERKEQNREDRLAGGILIGVGVGALLGAIIGATIGAANGATDRVTSWGIVIGIIVGVTLGVIAATRRPDSRRP